MFKTLLVSTFILAITLAHHEPGHECPNGPAVECDESEHHLHCHWPDDDTIHLCEGESAKVPNKCLEMTCLSPIKDLLLIKGCRDVEQKPGCTIIPEDASKPYPQCCAKLECPNNGRKH